MSSPLTTNTTSTARDDLTRLHPHLRPLSYLLYLLQSGVVGEVWPWCVLSSATLFGVSRETSFCANTVRSRQDNTRYGVLQVDSGLMIYRGADQPDMSIINPEADVWQHVKVGLFGSPPFSLAPSPFFVNLSHLSLSLSLF